MEVIVKNIICVFTVKNGEIYILIDDDKIPCITCNNEIDIVNKNYIDNLNIECLNLKQTYTFSEKKDDKLIFYILFNDIVHYKNISKSLDIISIDEVKDDKFIIKGIEYLKENIVDINNLKKIFNSEFALPELQKLLEKVLNIKFDRRNFRKKLLSQNLIEQVDKLDDKSFGRPAKLYVFKETIENIKIL